MKATGSGFHPHPGSATLTLESLHKSNLPPNASILDLGCGEGASCHLLAGEGYQCFGIDRRVPEESTLFNFCAADFCYLPFEHGSFDALLCECVLSLQNDLTDVLQECQRVLRPNGKLIINDIYLLEETTALAVPACTHQHFTEQTLSDKLEKHGFRPLLFEDQSEALRQLAFKLLWEEGSLESLGIPRGTKGLGKLGYFLCIAQRA